MQRMMRTAWRLATVLGLALTVGAGTMAAQASGLGDR